MPQTNWFRAGAFAVLVCTGIVVLQQLAHRRRATKAKKAADASTSNPRRRTEREDPISDTSSSDSSERERRRRKRHARRAKQPLDTDEAAPVKRDEHVPRLSNMGSSATPDPVSLARAAFMDGSEPGSHNDGQNPSQEDEPPVSSRTTRPPPIRADAFDGGTGSPFVFNTKERRASPGGEYHSNRRSTVCGVPTNLDETRLYQPSCRPKPEPLFQELLSAIRKCHLFGQLDDKELSIVVNALERIEFVQGEFVFVEGTSSADPRLYVIEQGGEVSVMKNQTVIRVLGAGATFGEREVMFVGARATHSVRIDSERCVCFGLGMDAYRHIVTRAAIGKWELYEGFLDRVPFLKGLTKLEKLQLADALQPMVYNDGEYLIEYNTIGAWMFLILEGGVSVYGRENGEVMFLCTFGVGDCVGELEFINNHRTVADVRATGRVKAARLHRDHFEMCMGPIVDVLRRSAKADGKYAYYHRVMRAMRGGDDDPAANRATAAPSPPFQSSLTAIEPPADRATPDADTP